MSSFGIEGDLISFACCSSSTMSVLLIKIRGICAGILCALLIIFKLPYVCPIVHNLISILQLCSFKFQSARDG